MNASRLVIEGCAVATLDPSGSLNAEMLKARALKARSVLTSPRSGRAERRQRRRADKLATGGSQRAEIRMEVAI